MAGCEPWPLSPHCLPECWSTDPEEWTEQQARAVRIAFSMLSTRTGGVYGLCTVTVRPCRWSRCQNRFPYLSMSSSPWTPVLHDGKIYNIYCGCVGECGCGPICEVPLDYTPVYDIVEVTIDGERVDPNTYRVDVDRRGQYQLVRTSGPCWPDCQDIELPPTEPDTWAITYRYGTVPGPEGELALSQLAVEVDKLCRGTKNCVLSDRVVNVTREGVEYELERTPGMTGIKVVDDWVRAVNPYQAAAPMQVFSPDTRHGRRTVWTGGQVPQ